MPPRPEEICDYLCIHWVLAELRFIYRKTGRFGLANISLFKTFPFVRKYLYMYIPFTLSISRGPTCCSWDPKNKEFENFYSFSGIQNEFRNTSTVNSETRDTFYKHNYVFYQRQWKKPPQKAMIDLILWREEYWPIFFQPNPIWRKRGFPFETI